jgi:hypothetical protein
MEEPSIKSFNIYEEPFQGVLNEHLTELPMLSPKLSLLAPSFFD